MTERNTGLTTRQLLDILEMTEGPQRVLFVYPEERYIGYVMKLLFHLLHETMPLRTFRTLASHTIEFPMNDSLVHVTWANQIPEFQFRRNWDSVVIDHACGDMFPRATVRWLDCCAIYSIRVEQKVNARWQCVL